MTTISRTSARRGQRPWPKQPSRSGNDAIHRALAAAAALGLCVAIPFGPIGLMCVQRTLAFGIWFGIASAIGAATAHGMFSCLAAVSGTVLTQMTLALHTPLRITEGIVLVLMGLRTILVSTRAGTASGAETRHAEICFRPIHRPC